MQLDVSILGPLEVHADGTPIPIAGTRLRTLLTRLALDTGRTISTTTVTDALWNEQPPHGAANALQSLISRLRQTLGNPDTITATPTGYRLNLPETAIDAHRFETLTREAQRWGRTLPRSAVKDVFS